MAIQLKATEQFCLGMLFIMLHKVVVEYVGVIRKCDHANGNF